MEVNFGASDNSAPVPEVAPQTAALVPVTAQPVEKKEFAVGDILPRFQDIVMPRLAIVHPSSRIKDSFVEGSLVYAQNTELFRPARINAKSQTVETPATAPLNVTFLGKIRDTRFVEKVKNFGSGQGQIVNSEADVARVGGTLDYQEAKLKERDGIRLFEPLLEWLVAIARPEIVPDDDTLFSFPVGSDKYTLAVYGCKGSAYVAACKEVLFPARLLNVLRKGYYTHSWSLSTRLKTYKTGNKSWVPVLVPREKASPEFLDFVRNVVNPGGSAAAEAAE